jgi:colanic acid biosynthesis glycosyl transferase WcaI
MCERKMRILLIGINYSPEETGIGPYTAALAERLASEGNSVVALTGLPSYPQWEVRPGYRHRLWKRDSIHGVDVRRRWHHVPKRQSALRRGLYEGSFLLTGLSMAFLPQPDVVLGVVPSLSGGLLARLASRRFGVPYGLIFQDLVGQAAEQSGVGAGGPVASGVKTAEGWIARDAAAIGVVADGFKAYLTSLGVEQDRIHRVRNWTHIEPPSVERDEVRRQFGLPEDVILCLHAGNMGHKQGLENILECARLAEKRDGRFLFVLLGDGNRRSQLESIARQYALSNVRFLPVQPDCLFPSVLAAADILLVNQLGSVCDMSLPSKLTSYFCAARPVVAAVHPDSEAAREIEASGGGQVVPPEEPGILLKALQNLAGDPELCLRMGRSAFTWSATELSEEMAMDGYRRLLSNILPATSRVAEPADVVDMEILQGSTAARR